VAVLQYRAVVIEPVGLKVPVAGSYSSAEASPEPPATSIRPSSSSVAVGAWRPTAIEPVRLNADAGAVEPDGESD
jgi:hypothetical protein